MQKSNIKKLATKSQRHEVFFAVSRKLVFVFHNSKLRIDPLDANARGSRKVPQP